MLPTRYKSLSFITYLLLLAVVLLFCKVCYIYFCLVDLYEFLYTLGVYNDNNNDLNKKKALRVSKTFCTRKGFHSTSIFLILRMIFTNHLQ